MNPSMTEQQEFDTILRFEGSQEREMLYGWEGGPPETIFLDQTVVHSGCGAARLERDKNSPNTFSSITKRIPIHFGGDWIELRGFLRTEGITEFAGLWMHAEGRSGVLEFDNMRHQGIRGTTDWTEYTIRLPLDPKARELFFGVVAVGVGTVWADDLQILVDGKPIAEAPECVVLPTILDTDREFDPGSGIHTTSLSELQIDHLVVLAKVWGFLKYHHPCVAAGTLHWDYELFRVLPALLQAPDRQACNAILEQWIQELGVPEEGDTGVALPEDTHLLPELDWIRDTPQLGPELSRRLQQVYAYRFAGDAQFYVSTCPHVGNPVFDQELVYADHQPPDTGFRLLALLRLWNIIVYWFPYRDLLDDDWHEVLRTFLPRFAAADSGDAYRLELLAFITRIQDTHAQLEAAGDICPPRGRCAWPVTMRFVEGRPTVIAITHNALEMPLGLEIGDAIVAIDGQPIDALIEAWSPYYSASNQSVRLYHIARYLSRGDCGASTLTIEREGEERSIGVPRLLGNEPRSMSHDRPGETFQRLVPEVAYLKLSGIRVQDVQGYLEQASGTRGLVIDIRNYPSEFVVFALGARLVQNPITFARFTTCDLHNPGAFTWTEPVTLEPEQPTYEGNVAILVDESSISQAEYTAMALRAGSRAVVVGSTTAGADGNVSRIPLPGGLATMISGIGVFYPDKRPTQRVGIIPDIEVKPTIQGIREGRDEVLEAAIRHLLGPEADEARIRQIARRNETSP